MVAATEHVRPTTRTVSATEARVHLGEMIRAVNEDGQDIVIEKAGRPEVVMISVKDYEAFRRLSPRPEPQDWYERMMELQREIAAEWKGPPLSAEDVDDMINYGQR